MDLISRLEAWLHQNRPGYLRELQPGVTAEDLKALERRIGRKIPTQLAALYRWRNGQGASCYKALHDNRMFMPLESVAESWQVMTELLNGGDFDRRNWWQSGWIPFLHNGGGDHLCLDVDGAFTGQHGQILEFRHDDAARTVLFPDFETYFESLVTSLEETEWEEDEEYWEIDLDIAARVAPGYPKRFRAGS